MSKRDAEEQALELERRAAALRKVVDEPSAKERAAAELAEIERQLAEGREADGRTRAKERLTGIRRAIGSVVASMEEDEKRVHEKKAEYEEALRRLNSRWGQMNGLRLEANALCDRFSLTAPALPQVTAPALRGIDVTPNVTLAKHVRTRPATERCEHGIRERRTYQEVRGSDGYAVIAEAGLRPFPELTAGQQNAMERREREQRENERINARMLQEMGETKRALNSVPGMVGVL